MPEVWKPITGFDGRYEVSDQGRVRSVCYRRRNYRKRDVYKILTGSLLNGYIRYNLSYNKLRRLVFGHVLVLEEFVGPRPTEMEGCHDDNNRGNNKLGNLRWDTQVGNQADRLIHGTDSRGEKSGKAKISEKQALEIRSRRLSGERALDIARDFGVTDRTVRQIASGERWGHLAFA